MSAKRHLHILLVASLIVLLFALLPANAEVKYLDEIEIEHFNTKTKNYVDVKVVNYEDVEVDCNLILTVYSKDLTENLPIDNSTTFFQIGADENYTQRFEYVIPLSGEYSFNISLLTDKNGIITRHYKTEDFTFYDTKDYQIGSITIDYYYDQNDNANWIYDNEHDLLELKNIEDSYETGVVLGPFETSNLTLAQLNIEYQYLKSLNSNYSIFITSQFNSSGIYGTEWELLHCVKEENNITVEIPTNSVTFILLRGSDLEPNVNNFWRLKSVSLEKHTVKHSLSINVQSSYFFEIGQEQELIFEARNTGNFDQQLGNVSIVAELHDEDGIVESQAKLISIQSRESQDIKINFDKNLVPGNYFFKLKVVIIEKSIFFSEEISFLSVSNLNYGEFEINLSDKTESFSFESQNDNIELLINCDSMENLTISTDFKSNKLTENYFIISIENANKEITFTTNSKFNAKVLSIINLDEIKYSVIYDNESALTIEGITAPAIVFDDGNNKKINIRIQNEGFYTETYNLNYLYSSTFISSIESIEKIQVKPNSFEDLEIYIKPLNKVPREGGSQFNIEVRNNNESMFITYIFSYLTQKIEINEVKCDRNAVLVGQDIKCTTTLTNRGYYVEDLTFLIYSGELLFDEVKINSLDYLDSWTLVSIYSPNDNGEVRITVKAITNDGNIFENEIKPVIKIVSAQNDGNIEISQLKIPEINTQRSLVLLTIAAIFYQINRSENLRYLGLKFFFLPMYSRLQRDTLADEPTRQKLLKYIYSKPGANFKQLKDKLSLHNGTLAHHINVLENHNIITSHRSGRQRLFFPIGINQEVSRISLVTNETQRKIIEIVKNTPGITQTMISKQLNMSRQKINYHVNSLVDKAFLNVEKQGRITRLYPLYYT